MMDWFFNEDATVADMPISCVILSPERGESKQENMIRPEYIFNGTFRQLYELMVRTHYKLADKKDADLLLPVSFLDIELINDQFVETESLIKRDDAGNRFVGRLGANVDRWYILPVDVDDGMTIDQAREKWKEYQYILYTSHSHMKDGVHKFRVFFLLESPVPNREFVVRKQAIFDWLGKVDETALSVSHGFYMPSYSKENEQYKVLEIHDGKPLNLLLFDQQQPKVYTEPVKTYETTDEERQYVINKLASTYLGNYNKWFRVACGLREGGYTLEQFKYATLNGMMRQKTAEDCEKVWRDIAHRQPTNKATMGTVWQLIGGKKQYIDMMKQQQKQHPLVDLLSNIIKVEDQLKAADQTNKNKLENIRRSLLKKVAKEKAKLVLTYRMENNK